jgi:oxygen-independent coproporphyrinogen-3 oxidase
LVALSIPFPQEEDVSLYIHVPFCTRKCAYCHFFVIREDEEKKEHLLLALLQEIALYSPFLKNKRLISVYFGGGTPALFGAERLEKVLLAIDQICPLRTQDLEISLEANPESLTKKALESYRKIGINRLSIGVQSLNDEELKLLTRTHTSEEAIKAIEMAYDAGIENLSIDLMYEIPQQTTSSWQHTLDCAVQLPISHISLYNMTIEPDTAFYRKKEKLTPLLPKEKEAKQMLEQLIATLSAHGFSRYEISAFCRGNLYSKHNTGYWLGRPFIGLGPSSFSFLPPKRFQNAPNFVQYLKLVSQGEYPVTFSEELNPQSRLRELFVVELRLVQGVDKAIFEKRYGSLPPLFWKQWQTLCEQKLVKEQEGKLLLTEKGRAFYDSVAETLI